MKRSVPLLQFFPWIGMILVVAVVAATGIWTNVALRLLEKDIPDNLLQELNDLSISLGHLSQAAALAEVARVSSNARQLENLRRQIEVVYASVLNLRESYVFDNMIQASAFHAAVAPAITDVQGWLAKGISGYDPESETTVAIVHARIGEAATKARTLYRQSFETARDILHRQRIRLEHFLFVVNLMFILTITITVLLVALMIHQQRLRRREMQHHEALREARQSLQQGEELQRRLVAALPDGVIRTDLDGTIRFINDVAVTLSGYRKSELLGKNMLTFIAETDRQRAVENAFLMMARPLGPIAYSLVMQNGMPRRFEVNGEVLRNPDGTAFGMVYVCRDISDRERLIEERRQLQERLHRAEKMEALGTLAGGVAHDLNNVLGVLVGYSELMLMDIAENDPLRRHVTHILDSGQRGAAIIQDLLTLARRGVAVGTVVDLNALVRQSLETPEFRKLKTTFPQVDIRTELDPELLHIKGSPVHLTKTVLNLVLNAVEAIEGTGQVTIGTENRYLDRPVGGYDAMKEGDYVVLKVSDSGQGIAEKDLAKIFEPFYTKKVMGRSGTGLGLAVVWGTVKDHDGGVDVQSRIGGGTTFTLYFPATRETIPRPEAPIPAETYAGRRESILVVDDVVSQRELARQMLEKIGYRVETAPGGQEAVDLLAAGRRFDLVMLDMIMDPGIDGLETYRRLHGLRPDQKTVIVSGFSESDRVKAAQALGAGPYVRKPYRLERLAAVIRQVLDQG